MSGDEYDPDVYDQYDDEDAVSEAEAEEWGRRWANAVWCWVCDEFHDPPRCAPLGESAAEVMRRLGMGDPGRPVRGHEPVVPPWHDRRRAGRPLFGWSSDHEVAVTWWPASDAFL